MKRFFWPLLALFHVFSSCGEESSETKVVIENNISERFKKLEDPIFVAPGSKDILPSPDVGELNGPALIRLYSEEGAKIYYSLQELSAENEGSVYKEPLLLVPPFTLYAVAEVGGEKGEVKTFRYTANKDAFPVTLQTKENRLREMNPTIQVGTPTSLKPKDLSTDAPLSGEFNLDGKCEEWRFDSQSRFTVLDQMGDVPTIMRHIDVVATSVHETGDLYRFMISTSSPPKSRKSIVYGFNLGPSNISTSSFGEGADYIYQMEFQDGVFAIYKGSNQSSEELHPETKFAIGDCLEIQIHKDNLTEINGKLDVGARSYAVDWTRGLTVRDKLLPIYLKSSFAVVQHQFKVDQRDKTVNFFVVDKLKDDFFVRQHLDFSAIFASTLARINGIPLYEFGNYPFYYTPSESSGYAGLNATDRGVLTTWGKNKSYSGMAQLVAHEFAHYQNAAFSKVTDQWMQEGMSEWSAERAMYHHLPSRAVYDIFKTKRVEVFLSYFASQPNADTYLERWKSGTMDFGYERAYMFFVLLDNLVGSEAIAKAFQAGYHQEMGGDAFKAFLERESGVNLDAAWQWWVTEANAPDADYHPDTLFKDDDLDGILNIDEIKVGLDPSNGDTDGDSYFDGEEFFRGKDGKTAKLESFGIASDNADVPSHSFRFQGDSLTLSPYGIDLDTSSALPYFYYPPVDIDVTEGATTKNFTFDFLVSSGSDYTALDVGTLSDATTIVPSTPLTEVQGIPLTLGTVDPGEPFGEGTPLLARDHEYDLDPEYGAYDIKSASAWLNDGDLEVRVAFRGTPDIIGTWGSYIVEMRSVEYQAGSSSIGIDDGLGTGDRIPANTLEIDSGEIRWAEGSLSQAIDIETLSITYNNELRISIPNEILGPWLDVDSGDMKCVRVFTQIKLTAGEIDGDEVSCIPVKGGWSRYGATFKDAYDATEMTTELFVVDDGDNMTDVEGKDYAEFLARTLHQFSRILKRPLSNRLYWPVRLEVCTTICSYLHGTRTRVGAAVRVPGNATDDLIKMELVRALIQNMLFDQIISQQENGFDVYVYEIVENWLLYKTLFATEITSDFDTDFLAEVASGEALPDTFQITDLGSITNLRRKAIAFIKELEDHNDTDAIASVFSAFYNHFPRSRFQDPPFDNLVDLSVSSGQLYALFEKYGVTQFLDDYDQDGDAMDPTYTPTGTTKDDLADLWIKWIIDP